MGTLLVLVWMFLKDRKDARVAGLGERKELVDRIQTMHEEHLRAREESKNVLKDVSISNEKVSHAMHEISLAIATSPTKGPKFV